MSMSKAGSVPQPSTQDGFPRDRGERRFGSIPTGEPPSWDPEAKTFSFGLSALFAYSPLAFDIVRYGGAVYLIYLGISGLISGGVTGAVANASGRGGPSLINSYWLPSGHG